VLPIQQLIVRPAMVVEKYQDINSSLLKRRKMITLKEIEENEHYFMEPYGFIHCGQHEWCKTVGDKKWAIEFITGTDVNFRIEEEDLSLKGIGNNVDMLFFNIADVFELDVVMKTLNHFPQGMTRYYTDHIFKYGDYNIMNKGPSKWMCYPVTQSATEKVASQGPLQVEGTFDECLNQIEEWKNL
jgi:hypothetical protein